MQEKQALSAFSAIAHESRTRIIRMLIVAGEDGWRLAAGAIASALTGAQPRRVSLHLKELENAELVKSLRGGRSIVSRVNFNALSDLVAFLMHDCCQGHCKYCGRAITLFAKCTGYLTD